MGDDQFPQLTPGGWHSANRIASATSRVVQPASAGGLYCSVRRRRGACSFRPESAVYADLAGGLGGERPGEPHHPELRRAVGGRIRDGLDPQSRRDVTMPPVLPAGTEAPNGPRGCPAN